MRTLALYNVKGGVGKTATAVNLAATTALRGLRTLVWDLDPQGATTFYFKLKPHLKGGGERLLKKRSDLRDHIRGTEHPDLDVLPSDFDNRHLDLRLEDLKHPERRLLHLLDPLEEDYDVVFLDCPPSVSRLSEAILSAAHGLLVPMIPTTLCLHTLDQIVRLRETLGCGGCRILPFFSMVDRRKALHLEILEALPRQHPFLLRTSLPCASEIERMGISRTPLPFASPRGALSQLYGGLWDEVEARLQV